MLRCLFWNQGNNDVTSVVAMAADEYLLDILAFCEVGANSEQTLAALGRRSDYHFTTGRVSTRFHIFTSFPARFLRLRSEAERFVVFDVRLPAREPFLLMVVHAPSKAAGWSPSALALEVAHYVSALRDVESNVAIPRSLIVGDFNMNPFEPGMAGASSFNAVMDARLANAETRTVQGRTYRYFYNPMWNLYGDITPGPPATLFHSGSTQEELHWHMLDQVLVSPEMIAHVDVASIKILDCVGDHQLVTKNGRPKRSTYSDHLPVYFELKV